MLKIVWKDRESRPKDQSDLEGVQCSSFSGAIGFFVFVSSIYDKTPVWWYRDFRFHVHRRIDYKWAFLHFSSLLASSFVPQSPAFFACQRNYTLTFRSVRRWRAARAVRRLCRLGWVAVLRREAIRGAMFHRSSWKFAGNFSGWYVFRPFLGSSDLFLFGELFPSIVALFCCFGVGLTGWLMCKNIGF